MLVIYLGAFSPIDDDMYLYLTLCNKINCTMTKHFLKDCINYNDFK